jgi:predicted deacylase
VPVDVRERQILVSSRVDGVAWRIRVVELIGSRPGPCTAFFGGIFGDKPLSCLALTELIGRLAVSSLRGSVLVVPAANPAALEAGTRINPDHLLLNRRFPGESTGSTTDQIAYAIFNEVVQRAENVVDLHSGTPTMGLWYIYDYGDTEFSASFGHLPIIVGHEKPGQLAYASATEGRRAALPEFGGGAKSDPSIGVDGCLNILRYVGQLDGAQTGPRRLPVVRDIREFSPSVSGVLRSNVDTGDVGSLIEPGSIGFLVSPATGETLEEFVVQERPALLLLARTTPMMITPGDLGFMVGYVDGEIDVPTR